MSTYSVSGINIASFNLGESDKVLTIFTKERGAIKAVAKGARKPGSKITGKADVLNVNRLLIAKGRSLDIITQAESLETFSGLRKDLTRLSFGLYYAELTDHFAQGLAEEANDYFDFFFQALKDQCEAGTKSSSESKSQTDWQVYSLWLCLKFELGLLDILGYKPELTFCVTCRQVINDLNLSTFDRELGGIVCRQCYQESRVPQVGERRAWHDDGFRKLFGESIEITPKVWKHLVLAGTLQPFDSGQASTNKAAMTAAHRLLQGYIEHRAGQRTKALDLVTSLKL
jgi:DNA repair protein RecO (recombination protein O)